GLIGFFIENQDTGSVNLVHTISYSNQNTKTTLLNPALQLMAKVEKTSGATDITLKNPSFAGIVQGIPNSNQDQRLSIAMTGAAFSVPTSNINHILSIQNNGVFNSLPNQVEVFPDWLSILNTGSSSAEAMFGIYLNATPSTTLSYNFVNQSSSVVSYSTTTATLSSGTLLATFYINGIDSGETILISLSDFKFQLEPGDVLSISGTTINGNQTTEARVSIGWHEAF
ncbi:hypothetical protein HYV11_02385, partial [Candidatus Dependentiae bacterium]|nr:hypothetical protein [Candidatus Dependentiae bacterium]